MPPKKWYNIKFRFPQTGKEAQKKKKLADIQARKWNFTSNLLMRGSDFLKNYLYEINAPRDMKPFL